MEYLIAIIQRYTLILRCSNSLGLSVGQVVVCFVLRRIKAFQLI